MSSFTKIDLYICLRPPPLMTPPYTPYTCILFCIIIHTLRYKHLFTQ